MTKREEVIALRKGCDEFAEQTLQCKGEFHPDFHTVSDERFYAIAAASRDAELEAARAELEVERMRLAACGVVAMSNTPESAAKAREMLPEYRSGSLEDIIRAVDSEMALREQLEAARAEIERLTAREWELISEKAPVLVAARRALADEQAKNVGLREAFKLLSDRTGYPEKLGECQEKHILEQALSAPSDTSALEAYVANAGEKMRERCEKVCDEIGDSNNGWCCEGAIRAIPGVTLEDLK